MPENYKTIAARAEAEIVEKKSRFIGHAAPVSSAEEALGFLARIREEHRDATHNCYAYIVGANMGVMRYSDDGEPGGTAGMPIIEVMKARGITNCAVVVTRYFGGVLLGAGGLVRAYSQGAAAAINACGVGTVYPTARYLIELPYPMLGRFEFFLKTEPVEIEDKQFTDVVTFTLVLKTEDEPGFIDRLTNATDGALAPLRYEEFLRPWQEN